MRSTFSSCRSWLSNSGTLTPGGRLPQNVFLLAGIGVVDWWRRQKEARKNQAHRDLSPAMTSPWFLLGTCAGAECRLFDPVPSSSSPSPWRASVLVWQGIVHEAQGRTQPHHTTTSCCRLLLVCC